jgi:acetyltransferase-like isoleucine patch superfamily enzyme
MKELAYQLKYALPVWLAMLLTAWLPDNRLAIRWRGCLVALFLPGRPRRLEIGRDVTLLGLDKLRLGEDVYLAKGCWLNAIGGLSIGSECVVSPYVVISSARHRFRNGRVRHGGSSLAAVTIGEGTWLAAHTVVNAGSRIGSGCIISAASFVSGETGDNRVLRGNPAVDVGENAMSEGEISRARS